MKNVKTWCSKRLWLKTLSTLQPGYEGVVGGQLASSPSQYQHHASIPAPAHRHSHQQHQYPVYTPPQSHQPTNVSDHTGMGSLLRRPCLLIAKAITWLPVCFILSGLVTHTIVLHFPVVPGLGNKCRLYKTHWIRLFFRQPEKHSRRKNLKTQGKTQNSSWKLEKSVLFRIPGCRKMSKKSLH